MSTGNAVRFVRICTHHDPKSPLTQRFLRPEEYHWLGVPVGYTLGVNFCGEKEVCFLYGIAHLVGSKKWRSGDIPKSLVVLSPAVPYTIIINALLFPTQIHSYLLIFLGKVSIQSGGGGGGGW